MLAHLPNRFNSLTRGRVRATCTPAENHYNGAKLFVFARFAFARSRVCTSPVSRDASRESFSTHSLLLSFCMCVCVCVCVRTQLCSTPCTVCVVYVYVRGNARPRFPRVWVVGWFLHGTVGKRRSCSPFSARSFYHAEVPEASEYDDDDDDDDDGVTSCQRRQCRNDVEYRVPGIEIENYTVC